MVLLFGCQKQSSEWQGTIEEVDGVTVVKNPQKPFYSELNLNLEEDLSIGNDDDDDYLFYGVSGIALDSFENIFVLDAGNHRIQKFDKDGRYIQTIDEKDRAQENS